MRKIAGPELPLFCALIIFFALVPGCRDETPQAGPVGAKAAAEAVGAPAANQGAPISEGSALEILQCGPAGQVKKLNQVAVMFNQPMTALGDYKNVPPGALVIAPALAGETRWLNQYTLAFAPETPLTGSHVLNVSVASGLTALSGAVLAEGANFEVRLPALGVERAYLLDAETADAAGALRPSWRVTFNQAVDLGSLEAFFEYEEAGAGKKTAAEVVPFQNERGADEFSFDFSASEALPKNTEYSLTLAAGAKSLAGPLPAAELNLGQGRTYGPLTAAIQDVSVDPAYGVYLDFSNPVRLKEVLPLIRINNGYDLTALMKAYAGDDEAAADGLDEYDRDEPRNYIYIPGGFKAQLDYAVAFEAGVKDIYGQELRPGTEVKFVTGEYSPFVRLDGNLGILETATEPKLGLTVRNLDEVEVLGYALEAETAVRFLSAANASPWYFYFNGEAMKELADVRPARLALRPPGGAKDGAALLPLDLARLFGDKLHGRLLYVRSNWKKGSSNGFDNTLIQITDIGLALKVGPASSLLWITNMPKGSAWAGAEAELRGPDGTLLWQGLSDENGLARMPGAQELAEKAPGARNFFVTARAEGQMALWNVNWNDGLEPWRWNINYADHFAAAADDHWLLSALPIYRPGETARFKIIARQNRGDQLLDLAGQEMEVEIRDGRGRVVDGGRVETNPFGTVDYETAIPADAALGDWVVNMARPGGEMRYVGGFGVYAYRAPAFEIKLEGLPREAVAGEKVAVTGRAAYHFGAPAAAQPVRYAVMTKRAHFSLPGAPDYHITSDFRPNDDYDDSDYGYYEPSVTVLSGQGFLAADGTVDIAVDLTPAADLKPAPRTYETHVVVEDVDRRTVAVEAGFLVHPAKIYAGLLSENFLAEAGRPHKVKVIAADIAGRLVPGREVNVTLYRRVWQSVRRKSAGSAYEYVSRVVDQEISKAVATTGELPVELELTPDKPGYYVALAEVKDDDGRLNQASCDFYVSGDGPVGWRMRNDDRLSLVADKKEHQPGDVARIMVQSPFDSGEGLLTIERAGVREARVFKIENQTPTFEVPISEDDAPNVFVSVLLARGRVADKPDRDGLDLGKPAVRLGYVELKIPSKKDLLTVEVKTDHEEVGPGDEVEVTVSVSNHRGDRTAEAEVALIAADAAVIQLAGDHNYYPDRQYHRDRPLTVQTAANLTSLIGRRNWGLKGANPGGGGGESGSRLDDGVRRLFAALAYFNPAVTLDENGEARVKIRMPENLTTFKIYAVATGHGRLSGTGQSSVLVTRDLLARSALPGYAGVGDEFTASMVVSNRGQNKGEALVELTGDGFVFLESAEPKTVSLSPGESREIGFKVKAGASPEARFLFAVKMGEEEDAVEYALPVSPPNQLVAQASYERLEPGEFRVPLSLPPGLDPARGGLELELSPSLVGVLSEPFDWLAAYPHGCVEQSTSKAYANLVWLGLKNRLNAAPELEEKARAHVQAQLARLAAWENDGGYNYWPENYNWRARDAYLSAYVLDFLLSAREAGFAMPNEEIIGNISSFLKNALPSNGNVSFSWPSWHSPEAIRQTKSYALAMLARAGENVAAYAEVMYNERETLGLFEIINLVRAINFSPKGTGQAGQIRELLALMMKWANFTADGVQFTEASDRTPEIWSSSIRTSAMALTALCEAAPYSEMAPGLARRLVSSSKSGHFGTTQNNVAALNALSLYVKLMEPVDPDLAVTALLGETILAETRFRSFLDKPVTGGLDAALIPADNPAAIYRAEGSGQAWAALKLRTAPLEPDLSAETSGGFMLSRSFTVVSPEAGPPGAETFRRGEVVRVSITMMVPAPRHSMALMDRVPAGLEPVNFNLKDADRALMDQLTQKGEDDEEDRCRSRYWYDHQEIWPDRVAVYADYLNAGVYTFSYLARAVTPGAYLTPGPYAEEMYAPETYGRGAGQRLVVIED